MVFHPPTIPSSYTKLVYCHGIVGAVMALTLLSLKRLRERPLGVVLSIVGIACGIALLVSVGSIVHSLQQSIAAVAPDPTATLQLAARSPLGFDEELVAEATADPDVLAATPELRRAVLVDDLPTMVIGRPDIAQPLVGSAFDGLTSVQADVRTATGTQAVSFEVTKGPAGVSQINGGRVLLLPLAEAQEVAGQVGIIDSAPLTVTNGQQEAVTERLSSALGPSVLVVPADAQQTYAVSHMEQVIQPVILMALVSLVAGGFLVFNTMQSTIRQRERELAVVRALGGTRRQITVGLFAEAAVLGVVGSVVGLVFGYYLGRLIVGLLPTLVATSSGTALSYYFDVQSVPLALLAGLGTSLSAAAIPVRRVLKARPTDVLHGRVADRALRPHRLKSGLLGPVVLVIGAAMTTSTTLEVAQNGIAVLLIGFLITAFSLADHLARAASVIASRLGALGSFVEADLSGSRRRAWSTTASVFIAVATIITVGGAARNQVQTTSEDLAVMSESDIWISTTRSDDLPIGFTFPSAAADELALIPGVTTVISESLHYAVLDGERHVVVGVDGRANYAVLQLAGVEAVDAVENGDGAVVTSQFARVHDLDVGDTIVVEGSRETIELPISGISHTISASNSGTVVIHRDHYQSAFGDAGASGFQLLTEPDADEAAIIAAARDLLTGPQPIEIESGDTWADDAIATTSDAANAFLIILAAIAAVTSIATLNSTASSVTERRRSLGVLRSLGAAPAQVRALIFIEVMAAGLVGAGVGLLVGLILHRVGVAVTDRATPFPERYFFSWLTVTQALLAAAMAVIVGALIPAWQTERSSITKAIGYE